MSPLYAGTAPEAEDMNGKVREKHIMPYIRSHDLSSSPVSRSLDASWQTLSQRHERGRKIMGLAGGKDERVLMLERELRSRHRWFEPYQDIPGVIGA